jgi:glutamate-ammonia-ligase adenylyltransferase
MGQNWERAAMIKARPVAGDLAAGARFLAHLRPYVWRKHLDFAAIEDIHSIKRQINDFRGGGTIGLAGHNIKLGRGGIREIEFFAQTLQLIWGGRDASLRASATCAALRALADAGRIAPETARELAAAYRFLRRIEHRLQMIDDRQTHTLPSDDEGLAHLATFLGHGDTAGFAGELTATLRLVERRYAELFEESRPLAGPGNLVFTGGEDDPATIETLSGMGFHETSRLAGSVRGWHHGRYRATRSQRAREILTELMPALLKAIARTPDPDATFLRFDQFLARLPAGVQLFSLFQANPDLIDLVAELLGMAPRLAEMLSERPDLFDAVLSARFSVPAPPREELASELRLALEQARDFQDHLDIGRRWKREREFQVGVRLLRGLDSIDATGTALADIADGSLIALQDAVEREFARSHGGVPGGGLCLIALGKLGGREMTVTSDLDLIFLYDAPAGIEASDGERPLPVSLYYTRVGTRLINAITALTAEGQLYEIDMRLRPSGAKGPIATSLDAFEIYQREQAWTWEHMALTRARPISGPRALRQRAETAIRAILTRPRDPARLADDVGAMRARLAAEQPPRGPFDVKYRPGGLIDIEFVAQYLQLRHAAKDPSCLRTGTRQAVEQAIAAKLVARAQGSVLLEGLHLWRTIQGVLRLSLGDGADIAAAPPALRAVLARGVGAVDFTALEHTLADTAARVRAVFDALLPARPTNQER